MVLRYIDNDHIITLRDPLEDIRNQMDKGKKELVKILKLWVNLFNDLSQVDEDANASLKNSFLTLNFKSKQEQRKTESFVTSIIMKGIQQATDLTSLVKSLKIPTNPDLRN